MLVNSGVRTKDLMTYVDIFMANRFVSMFVLANIYHACGLSGNS